MNIKKTALALAIQVSLFSPFALSNDGQDAIDAEFEAVVRQVMQQSEEAQRKAQEDAERQKDPIVKQEEQRIRGQKIKVVPAENLEIYKSMQKAEFMKHAATSDLDEIVQVRDINEPILTFIDFGATFDLATAEKSVFGNKDLSKMIDKEKKKMIYELYSGVIERLNQEIEVAERGRFFSAVDRLAKYNRLILPEGYALNQYPVPKTLTEDEEFNGPAYFLYAASNAQYDYLLQAARWVRDYVASPNHSLEAKMGVLDAVSKIKTAKEAEKYQQGRLDDWKNLSYSSEKINKAGQELFLSHPNKEALAPNLGIMLQEANKGIIEAEYNLLPKRITKAQYASLSDIDQSKYQPEVHKNYKSRSYYEKKSLQEVQEIAFTKELKKKIKKERRAREKAEYRQQLERAEAAQEIDVPEESGQTTDE